MVEWDLMVLGGRALILRFRFVDGILGMGD